jgi:hypothetical protein
LYKSFSKDRSSSGFIMYKEAKIHENVLDRSFLQASINGAEALITEQTKASCAAFTRQSQLKKSADLY